MIEDLSELHIVTVDSVTTQCITAGPITALNTYTIQANDSVYEFISLKDHAFFIGDRYCFLCRDDTMGKYGVASLVNLRTGQRHFGDTKDISCAFPYLAFMISMFCIVFYGIGLIFMALCVVWYFVKMQPYYRVRKSFLFNNALVLDIANLTDRKTRTSFSDMLTKFPRRTVEQLLSA